LPSSLGARALLALAVALAVSLAAGSASAQREQDSSFHSAALAGTLHYEVYLPADYDTSGLSYPVVYFLHGLPAPSDGYRSAGFVQNALDRLGKPAILVVPQGARSGDSDPEYLDRGPGRRWETAIALELKHVIDTRYRTIASRGGRAIIGVSAGGYGAMHIGLQYLSAFAVVESWSGYFHPTDPTGTIPLDLGSQALNAAADVHRQTKRVLAQLHALPTLIAFYVGRSDTRFAGENEVLNQELTRLRVPHVFRIYPGGHTQALWAQYAPAWLGLALSHLLAPR
jgi:S-formylglutathione hydrolase FrmB